jgi:putative ABC transport system substrate-binding protein
LHVLNAGNKADIDAAFARLKQIKAAGFLTMSDASFNDHRDQIAELAARNAIPGIAQAREYVEAGGLMSYGSNQAEAFRLLGSYAARILKGEKPADLPVQQATKIELAINMKTAKSLGLSFPITLLARADEAIE